MNFTGNTILVTGATSGIGLELATRFEALGNRVILAGRRQDRLAAIRAAHPGMAAYTLDVTDAAAIRAFAARVVREHPDLNVVVHNAGIMAAETLSAGPSDLAVSEAIVATNLLGPIRLNHALLPHLAARPAAAIVTVSSGLAFVPLIATPTYNATKAAVHSWSIALREQLRGSTVEVIELVPPGVQTDLMPGQADNPHLMPLGDFMAEAMALLIAQPTPEEVCVERVGFLRRAEAEGRFAQTLAALNAH